VPARIPERFFSNRTGAQGNDIYSARRKSNSDAWSTPVNLGPNVNSVAAETRPSLSWDGTTLYFGSTRTGGGVQKVIRTTT
jgi:OmpA-OmpF porin, OOP family